MAMNARVKELQNQHAAFIFADAAMDWTRDRRGVGIAVKDENGSLVTSWAIPTRRKKEVAILKAGALRTAPPMKAFEEHWTESIIWDTKKSLG